MRSIALINQKGGVGKTTVAINLSAALAREGRRVLLLDMDPQGHCAVGMAIPETDIDRTIADVFKSHDDAAPVELPSLAWQIAANLHLVPARGDLHDVIDADDNHATLSTRLIEGLDRAAARFDFVVMDCPPNCGPLVRAAIGAATEVIVPVDTGYFSLHALSDQLASIDAMASQCGKTLGVGVLANQYDVRTKLAREILAELRLRFGGALLDTTINFNTKLKEGASFGQPIAEYDPASVGARDFQLLARELINRTAPASNATAVNEFAGRLAADSDRLLSSAQRLVPAKKIAETAAAMRPAAPVVAATSMSETRSNLVTESPTAADIHRRIGEKLERIYGVQQTPEGVEFRAQLEGANVVQLAGDFNDWTPHRTPMNRRGQSDVFEARLKLAPGRYRYRFVVDGRWSYDHENPAVESNEYGEIHSVVDIC